MTKAHLRVQPELETNSKKRKTKLLLVLLNWLAWHSFFLFFYIFDKSPDTIKHPPKSFYFYKVLLNNILKRLWSKGVVFRRSSINCLVRLILNPSKTNAWVASIYFYTFSIAVPQICIFTIVLWLLKLTYHNF